MSVLTSPLHSALRCLFIAAMHHGVQITPQDLVVGTDSADPLGSVLRVMKKAGLKGRVLKKRKWRSLVNLGNAYPVIVSQKNGNWVLVVNALKSAEGVHSVAVLDPLAEQSGVVVVDEETFTANWDGTMVLSKRVALIHSPGQKFGLRWFMPEIIRQGRYFRDICIASFLLNFISFGTPILFQIMIDKVVSHKSYNTLLAVMLVFLVLIAFEAIFSYIRQTLMLMASTKIDARLASRTFQHLLDLPMTFFETNQAGVLARNMQQTETIRGFLTGRLLFTFLDCVGLPVLMVMLGFYSGVLLAVVLAFSAAIALSIAAMLPIFRHHLDQLYQSEGARQGHMVETIHGMRTVKSLVLGPARRRDWDHKVTNAMRRLGTVGRIGALAGSITHSLEKLMQMAILGVGAMLVFDNKLSIGGLIAFNMLAGRVSGPLVQIVGLINEWQQTALSIRMLGTIMDHPLEREPGQTTISPVITGEMSFDNVSFSYPRAANPALRNVTFSIQPGQVIGVVGRSGSGKSTLTRLIQGIHAPDEGMIKLSGADIRHIDLNHLRRSIGVVLQDNFLFRGTIHQNIAASKPDATLDEVMEAARLAGAEEFINRLPHSYETFIEEGSSNLSGGQRQRLAIARALLPSPRLLIFDEATSALDPESESIVQENLEKIAQGRTMVIVSHRLSSLVTSDAILVLEQGEVVDFAPHDTLVERCDIYRHLWQTQTQHVH